MWPMESKTTACILLPGAVTDARIQGIICWFCRVDRVRICSERIVASNEFITSETKHQVVKVYSCGTTDGHLITQVQHTVTILSIVDWVSWFSCWISEIGSIFCKIV